MIDQTSIINNLQLDSLTAQEQLQVLAGIERAIKQSKTQRQESIKTNVNVVIDFLKKVDSDIRSRYDEITNNLESKVATIKDIQYQKGDVGPRGEQGRDGREGPPGPAGRDGADGRNGEDGRDGVGVSDAKIDFDGSLVITLTDGRELNVGEVVPFDVAEKIRVITSNGGYGGGGGASLPVQTGNAGKFLTTDGTNPSWGTVSGTGSVTSVGVSGGTTGLTTSGGPVTTSGTITLAGTLAVANGGTGATDGAGARTNLSAQKTITSGTALPTGGVDGDIYLATGTTVGTINLLTQTSGATANQLMYGGASGQVAQTSQMAWSAATNALIISNSAGSVSTNYSSDGLRKTASISTLLLRGFETNTGTSNGGGVDLRGGAANVSGNGGTVTMRGGFAAGSGTRNGGNIDAIAGDASLTDSIGRGGFVSFQGGNAFGATAIAGDCTLLAGSVDFGGTAGNIGLYAGDALDSTGTPGDINIYVGGRATSPVVGNIYIGSNTGDPIAVTAGTGTTHAVDLPVIVDGTQYYIRLYS